MTCLNPISETVLSHIGTAPAVDAVAEAAPAPALAPARPPVHPPTLAPTLAPALAAALAPSLANRTVTASSRQSASARSYGPTGHVRPRGARTLAVRAGIASDTQYGAVAPPLHLSSTFSFAAFGQSRAFDYTRSGNPTRALLADALADLEHGAAAVVTSTGMSAVALVLQLLKPTDTILCAHDCYGGTYRLLQALAARGQFRTEFINFTAPGIEQQIAQSDCAMVWLETPSNPLLRITDIERVCLAAHRAGPHRAAPHRADPHGNEPHGAALHGAALHGAALHGAAPHGAAPHHAGAPHARVHPARALVVVDNTFLSPALQQPLTLGADIVVHSTTKYLNGHSDVVGGAVIAADAAVAEQLSWWANCLGVTGAPFDSYLTLRGVRTLHPRMQWHEQNARQIVEVLSGHPAVSQVNYPGLATHPGHDVATRQQSGFGAMVSFELRGGCAAASTLVSALECFTLAESLGGVESLVAHPATMTHASMDADARAAAGITDALFRLSVGIEDGHDLAADLTHALDCAHAAG